MNNKQKSQSREDFMILNEEMMKERKKKKTNSKF